MAKAKQRKKSTPKKEVEKTSKRKQLDRWLLLALGLGLVLRIGFLAMATQEPDFTKPYIDAAYHDVWARGMAFDDWTLPPATNDPNFENTPYFRGPGYPYMLAALYKVSGGSYLFPRIFQLLLGLLNIFLVFRLTRNLFSPFAARAAAIVMATYWGLIYYEAELLAPISMITILLVLIDLVIGFLQVRFPTHKSKMLAGLCVGLLFGLGSLFRANLLLCGPLVLLAMALPWIRQRSNSQNVLYPCMMLLGAALTILPVTYRNYAVSGELVLISSNSGINLYIGNNETADGYSAVIPDLENLTGMDGWNSFDYDLICQRLSLSQGREMNHSDVSSFFSQKAKSFIFSNPGHFISLCFKRLGFLLGPEEPHNNKMLQLERDHNLLLKVLPRWSLLISIGLFGFVFWIRKVGKPWKDEGNWPLLFLVLTGLIYAASYLPFFMTGRFRMPLVPLLAIFAGFGVSKIWEFSKAQNWKSLVLLPIILGLSLVAWVEYDLDESYWFALRGARFEAMGNIPEAEACWEESLKINPKQHEALTKFGILRYSQGREAEARDLWERSIEANPSQPQILNNLAWVISQDPQSGPQHYLQALDFAEKSVDLSKRLEPGYLHTLAVVQSKLGRRDEARTNLDEALELAKKQDNQDMVQIIQDRQSKI